jgi:hypothetical protein
LGKSASYAQVLPVKEIIQEKDQWCWSASSKCILDYYGFPQTQCNIAEFARSVITWRSFGKTNCCVNADSGCNYWNYLYGANGSINDILMHFGALNNNPIDRQLSLIEINNQIKANQCFVVRWGWVSGGGHFVVGHGVNANDVYYMNPWFGEGLHIGTYDWLVNDGIHTWTHSDTLSTSKLNVSELNIASPKIELFPNPNDGYLRLRAQSDIQRIQLVDLTGRTLKLWEGVGASTELDITEFACGVYCLQIESNGYVEIQKITKK